MRKEITIILVGVSLIGLAAGYWAATTYLPLWFAPSASELGGTVPGPAAEATEVKESNLPGRAAVEFSQTTATVGEEVTVQISLDTGGRTISGFDLILQFDPQAWEVLTPQVTVAATQAFVTYPVNEVSSETGTVRLSGLTDLERGFTGEVSLGSFLLRPQKSGSLEISVVFEGVGVGTDTNLAEQGTGKDILGGVENGILEVKE